jgi:hypothetical protein
MEMSSLRLLWCAAILGSCLPLTAQTPQVQGFELKWLDDTPQGAGIAQLTNRREAAATAYIVQFERVDGDSITVINSWPVQAVPRGAAALEPGQSKTFTAAKGPNKAATANTVRVVCAIFADGFTTGDDLCVKRFLDKRRQLLREDIPRVLEILNAALTQDKPDLNFILGEMNIVITERLNWAKEQTPVSPILAEARAHATVRMTVGGILRQSKDKPLVIDTLKKLIDLLQTWRGDLEASKPQLPE